MSDLGVRDLVVAGELDEAVRRARALSVADVIEQLDHATLDEHAEQGSAFLQQWVPALPPHERLPAAEWAAGQYVTALVHLDGAYGTGARLLLDALRAMAGELADALRGFSALTDGPDAEVVPQVAERLAGYAGQLDAMDFTAY